MSAPATQDSRSPKSRPQQVGAAARPHVDIAAPSPAAFDYDLAFSRNLGWVTADEQARLRGKCVAIAGLGGVGGSHLLTLTRLGLGAFHIADLDRFELANFNRQAGAAVSRLGHDKVHALADMALDINPELRLRRFAEGVTAANVDAFLDGVDLYLDSLDFFAVDARRMLFAACARRGIPAVTAAPLGMGVALLNFLPGGMTFEQYFQLEGQPRQEQYLRFLIGLSPAFLQARYLVDPSRVDLAQQRGPSTPMACELCAGVAATHVLKILLQRGPVPAAPHGLHFDAYRNRLAKTWRPWGNANPLQRVALHIARKRFSAAQLRQAPESPSAQTGRPIERILDLARWAPSGDNTQPWRFEIVDDQHLILHGHDTRDHVVYDLQGRASQVSLGALLETITIAATGQGMRASFVRRLDKPDTTPTFDVFLDADAEVQPDALLPFVTQRVTQRRPMRTQGLSPEERDALTAAVGRGFQVMWIQGLRQRARMARLLFRNAHIRLTIPEAYRVHRDIIQWHSRYSEDRIPDQALGANPVATRLMQWAMASWDRVDFMNRWLGGTLLPRLELDVLPALCCGAHAVLLADRPPQGVDDYIAAGRAVQRFWLTAASLGLQFQPEMTPLIFASYVRQGVRFCGSDRAMQSAEELSEQLDRMLGEEALDRAVFLCRLGHGRAPRSRSLRLPLAHLGQVPAR